MNSDILQGKWKEMKGKVRQQWGKLTDSDIDRIGGKKDELAGTLQRYYGISKDQADKEIDEFSTRMN